MDRSLQLKTDATGRVGQFVCDDLDLEEGLVDRDNNFGRKGPGNPQPASFRAVGPTGGDPAPASICPGKRLLLFCHVYQRPGRLILNIIKSFFRTVSGSDRIPEMPGHLTGQTMARLS
jgi:hypothetical protein